MPYLGASPRNINTRSVIDHQEYLGSQADTSTNSGYYTFYVNYTPGNVSVVVRGVHMASSDYTATNGTDVRISTSTITLANDDVIEIIGYGIPSSQILERSDVNITGGQAINLTQVGASSYKVGNTEVIDSSGNLISGTLGANVSFANIADDAISGDKIHSGTISSSTLDGIKLKSSGDSITKSDGTTAVLSESGGVVTLNNGTIGSGVTFPALGNSAVGTVSQSSGTPTGDIIEYGSNPNGEFVKYADGTMICMVITSLTDSSNGRYDTPLPANFSDATSSTRWAFGSEDQGASFTRFYNVGSVSTGSTSQISAYLGVSSISYAIRYTVIGRWY